jgi:hypothetical protein
VRVTVCESDSGSTCKFDGGSGKYVAYTYDIRGSDRRSDSDVVRARKA